MTRFSDTVSAEEHARLLERVNEALNPMQPVHSITDQVVSWSRLAKQVQQEYRLTIFDLTNSLTQRDCLEVALNCADGPTRATLQDDIEEADTQYLQGTVPLVEPLRAGKTGWWWRRAPRLRNEALEEEIRDELVASGYLT